MEKLWKQMVENSEQQRQMIQCVWRKTSGRESKGGIRHGGGRE